jgi:hypothetical protein
MLMVDLRSTNARLTVQDILNSGRRLVSNPIAFAAFLSGLRLPAAVLADKRWQLSGSASGGFAFFRTFLHEIVPEHYDVRHLEHLGGCFSLRLTGVGDFSVMALNRRVVTLRSAPIDEATRAPVIDVEMRADVLMAVCNELLASLSERTLKALADKAAAQPRKGAG